MRLLLLINLFLLSCKKEVTTNSSNYKVEYQVNGTGYYQINTIYTNEGKQQVGAVTSSGWVYDFSSVSKPITLYIKSAMAENTSTTHSLEVKILVNGQVVASGQGQSGNWQATAQYTIN